MDLRDVVPGDFAPRRLGRSGLKISGAVMGTMTFGGDADESESRSVFDTCLDHGVYTFDCANVYNSGRSEELLGRFASGRRSDLVLTTKAYFPTGAGPNDRGASRRHLTQSIEASLKRLRTDYIDIFFIHRFDPNVPVEEVVATLDAAVARGAILYIGLSNYSAWQAQQFHDIAKGSRLGGVACVQPMYNLMKRQCEVEILPQARAEGIGVMTYSPLAAGLLTGAAGRGSGAGPNRRMATNVSYQKRYRDDRNGARLEAFATFCAKHELEPAHVALAWVASNDCVTAPILGARSHVQLTAQLQFTQCALTAAHKLELDEIFAPPPLPTDRSEELDR